MYAFELLPQLTSQNLFRSLEQDLLRRVALFPPVSDIGSGHISWGTPELEPAATNALEKNMGMPLYPIGYLGHEVSGEDVPELGNHDRFPGGASRVRRFMDEMHGKYGERSMTYIRYASLVGGAQ